MFLCNFESKNYNDYFNYKKKNAPHKKITRTAHDKVMCYSHDKFHSILTDLINESIYFSCKQS